LRHHRVCRMHVEEAWTGREIILIGIIDRI
jgi:hypothetical protein